MSAPAKIEAAGQIHSWAERWSAAKGSPYWRQTLLSIAEEANRPGPDYDRELHLVAFDAATVADPDDRAMFIGEVERIFAEYAEVEAWGSRAYAYETRTGKPWESSPTLTSDYEARSHLRVTEGMGA